MPYTQNMRNEMLRLAQVLLEQTKQEKIKWSSTDEENQFLFSSTKSSMLIDGSFGSYEEEDEGDFTLVLLNRGGSVAARLEISFEDANDIEETLTYDVLKELYLEAQNKALEIDNTLEDMHRALGMEEHSESTFSDGSAEDNS